MSGQLRNYASRIINPLDAFQRQLAQIAASHRSGVSLLLAEEESLTSISEGPSFFAGLGASAFVTVCKLYASRTEQNAQLIDQAVQATLSCIDEIWQATNTAEMAYLNDNVVFEVLTRTTIDSLLSDGSTVVTSILNEVVHGCVTNGNFFGQPLTQTISTTVHAVVNTAQNMIHMESEVWNLLGELPRILGQWAWDINNAISHYTYFIKNLTEIINNIIVQQSFNEFKNDPSLSNLYEIIQSTEGTDKPITISNMGNNTILVTIAGLDPNLNHLSYLNNWLNALLAGGGDPNNAYTIEAEREIQQYLIDHHLPPNTKVIIAGHSLGGMIAQYIYQASKDGKTRYTVNQIITFGSPQVIQSDPNTHEYANVNDPVPLLSWYKEGPAVAMLGLPTTLVSLAALNIVGGPLKELYTGEKIIYDEGNSPNPLQWFGWDHDYSNSKWLQSQQVQFSISQTGQIQNYP